MKLTKPVRQALAAYNRANKNYHKVIDLDRKILEKFEVQQKRIEDARNRYNSIAFKRSVQAGSEQKLALSKLMDVCDSAGVPVAQLLVTDNPVKL